MKYAIMIFAVSLALIGVQKSVAQEDLRPRPVLWTTATSQSARDIQLIGMVEPQTQINHAFRTLGRLVFKGVSIGDIVTKGQVLASIDTSTVDLEIQSARAGVSNAEAHLASIEKEENRLRTLLETGTTTQASYDVVTQQLESARASLTQAITVLSKAEEQLGYTDITAELDGIIIGVFAQTGEIIAPGATVFTIADLKAREAVVDMPDTIARHFPVNTNASVTLELDSLIQARGVIREISPVADTLSRTVRARIVLERAPLAFRIGTTVIVTFSAEDAPMIRLPETAVFMRNGEAFVWAITDDNRSVASRPVTLGETQENRVEILDGVATGDRVVVAGAHSLEENQSIRLGKELTF